MGHSSSPLASREQGQDGGVVEQLQVEQLQVEQLQEEQLLVTDWQGQVEEEQVCFLLPESGPEHLLNLCELQDVSGPLEVDSWVGRERGRERPFHCTLCPPSSREPYKLLHNVRKHISTQHLGVAAAKRLSCPVCGKMFESQSGLRQHRKDKCLSGALAIPASRALQPQTDMQLFRCCLLAPSTSWLLFLLAPAPSVASLNLLLLLLYRCAGCSELFSSMDEVEEHMVAGCQGEQTQVSQWFNLR